MTEINKHLLDLIMKGISLNQISQELLLSNKQIYSRLISFKRKGFDFLCKYYSDGNLVYSLKDRLINIDQSDKNEVSIITKPSEDEFRALAIADLHIGSELERMDLLNKIYDYCIVNNIHIIIVAGDLIDGFLGSSEKKHTTHEEQIKYFIKKYPHDKNILNFACLGNHDIDSLHKTGQNFQSAITNSRPDIISIGYGTGIINVKRDQIIVQHPLIVENDSGIVYHKKLVLKGHSHKMKCNFYDNNILFLPSLSDIKFTHNEFLPGAVKITLTFLNGIFKSGLFEHLLIDNKIYIVNEMNCDLVQGKNQHQIDPIPFEENYDFSIKPKTRVLTSSMSQVEKFNARYERRNT